MAPIRKRRTAGASGDVEKTEKAQSESEVQPDSYAGSESVSDGGEENYAQETPADVVDAARPVRTVKTKRRLNRALHFGHFFGAFVDEQNDEVNFGMIFRNRVCNLLHEDRFAGFRRSDDQEALSLTDRIEEIEDAR